MHHEAGVSLVFDIQQRKQRSCPTSWKNLQLGVCIQVFPDIPLNFTDISIIFLRGFCSLDVTLLGSRHIYRPFPGWAQVSWFCWPRIPAKINSKFLGHANSAVTSANKSEPNGEIQVYLVCAKDRPSSSQRSRALCTVNKQNQEMKVSQKHWY